METSSLENIGQKKLYTILYFAKQYLDGDKISHNSMEEDDVMEAFDSAVRLVVQTQRRELEYIDTNFLMNLYMLNFDKINGPKDFVDLTIPQAKQYTYEVETDENERVITTYLNTLSSYSKHTVSSMIDRFQKDGNFDYYEGRIIDREVVDSDFNDVNINYKSIKEVSPKK